MLSSDNDCKHDLSQLKFALGAGMNLAVSHWGGTNDDLKWLNGDSNCTGDCSDSAIATMSNINTLLELARCQICRASGVSAPCVILLKKEIASRSQNAMRMLAKNANGHGRGMT